MRARDYMSPSLKVEVSVVEDREVSSEVGTCDCCGGRLDSKTFDPAGYRGFEVSFSVVTVRSWDVECLDEEPMVETFRTHDECATDFEDAIKLHNAGLVAERAVETIATAIGSELGNTIAKIDGVAA